MDKTNKESDKTKSIGENGASRSSYINNQIGGSARVHMGNSYVGQQVTFNIGRPENQKNPIHWTVTRSANALFTGRDSILQELDVVIRDQLSNASHHCPSCVVISGIGGQGKSEIALQLAYRLRSQFWGVFWIDVGTDSSAENGFLNIATSLNLKVSAWEDARQALARRNEPWLLVLDNADNPEVDYQQYFPPSPNGTVIITSRNIDCRQYATMKWIDLEGLTDSEAEELLFRTAHVLDDQRQALKADAYAVTSLLKSHPLAVIQAGSYICHGHCTIKDYPDVYMRQRKRLLEFRPSQALSRYRDVYATFEASAETLQSLNVDVANDALQLLPVFGMCGPNRLPVLLFISSWKMARAMSRIEVKKTERRTIKHWHVARLPVLFEAVDETSFTFRLFEAINLLKAFSLVSTESQGISSSVTMHPLIHAWATDRLNPSQHHESWVQAGCVVGLSGYDADLWRIHARQLQPHLQMLTIWPMTTMFAAEPQKEICAILVRCGWLLDSIEDNAKLFALLKSIFAHLGLSFSEVDQDWIEVYFLQAKNLLAHGQVRKAIFFLEQIVSFQQRILPKDNPELLSSQRWLAEGYKSNGQVKKALPILEEWVKIEARRLPEKDRNRLIAEETLAAAYRKNHQITEAVVLLEHVVRIREEVLSEDHPELLTSQHALASAYRQNGQVAESLSLFEQVVRISELTLAEESPDRLSSQHELARVYTKLGQVQKAISLLEKVVKIQEGTLAADHPDQLTSQHELSRAYYKNKQTQEAISLLQHVVKMEDRTLAEDHPDRLDSQHQLARFHWGVGEEQAAINLMRHVVMIQQKSLDENDPDRKSSESWLQFFESEMGLTSQRTQNPHVELPVVSPFTSPKQDATVSSRKRRVLSWLGSKRSSTQRSKRLQDTLSENTEVEPWD